MQSMDKLRKSEWWGWVTVGQRDDIGKMEKDEPLPGSRAPSSRRTPSGERASLRTRTPPRLRHEVFFKIPNVEMTRISMKVRVLGVIAL